MNAIQLLRTMHGDTKVRFKLILGEREEKAASDQWNDLQKLMEIHEQIEDRYVYTPISEEQGLGTPLGDWDLLHEDDVAWVKALIGEVEKYTPATPDWRTAVGRVNDALAKHVTDEEGQIFGRIEQVWGPERLDRVGAEMQKHIPAPDGAKPAPKAPAPKAAAPSKTTKNSRRKS